MAYKIVDVMERANKYSDKASLKVIAIAAIFLSLFYSSAIVKWAESLPVNSTSDQILRITKEWHKVTKDIRLNKLEELISSSLGN